MGDCETIGGCSKGQQATFSQKYTNTVFQIFKDATAFFSHATPNFAKVIPAMDDIDCHLATIALTNMYKPCIQAAVTMAKNLLNKCYSATDHSKYCHG